MKRATLTQHFDKGRLYHLLSYPSDMREADAKLAAVDEQDAWNYLKEVDRKQVGSYTVVLYEFVMTVQS